MLEFLAALVYLPGMSQTLEKRVEELEKKVAELSGKPSPAVRKKDPWRTFGTMEASRMEANPANPGASGLCRTKGVATGTPSCAEAHVALAYIGKGCFAGAARH